MNRFSAPETFQQTQPIPLFDFEPTQEEEKVSTQNLLGVTAVEKVLSQSERSSYQPLSIESVQQEQSLLRSARQEEDRPEDRISAWEDIGYSNPETRVESEGAPLESSIASYQPWHRDVRIGVEQFGITKLTNTLFKKHFNESQQHAYLLQLYSYRERIKTNRRLILEAEGSIIANPELKSTYGEHSPETFLRYADQLTTLLGELESTPMIACMHQAFPVPESAHPSRQADMRRKYLAEGSKLRKQRGVVQVSFDSDDTPRFSAKRK